MILLSIGILCKLIVTVFLLIILRYFFKNMNGVLGLNEKPNFDTKQELEKLKLEKLREKHRNEKLTYRENQREFVLKKVRFLKEGNLNKNLTEYDITTLANILKNKGQVSCELLNTIMNSLLDSKENITRFLKVDGALQALLRLLSGQNEKFQLIATQCICNLALGDEKQSLQILKASESYLMMHLSGRNCYVMEACAIALGNLSRQSLKNVELLINQDFFSKIIYLLSNDDPNVEGAAIYALTQMIYHGFDIVRSKNLESCFLAILPIFKKRSFSVAFLMSVLSSCKDIHKHFISNDIQIEALKYLLISLEDGEKEAVYFLRIVSNLIHNNSGYVGLSLIENHSYILKKCMGCLLQSEKKFLKKECLGLIGNLLNHEVEKLKMYGLELFKENFELINLYKSDCHFSSLKDIS